MAPLKFETALTSSGCGDSSPPSLACLPPSSPWASLHHDVLLNLLMRLDLPDRLAAMCVCRDWRASCGEPSLWSSICVPEHKAFRLWDSDCATLIQRCQGHLHTLNLSNSGITGKALIRLLQSRALAPEVEELQLRHCCNLKACDILAFVQALAPSPPPSPSPSPSRTSPLQHQNPVLHFGVRGASNWHVANARRAPGNAGEVEEINRQLEALQGAGGEEEGAVEEAVVALELGDVLPPRPPPCFIRSLKVDGCKQLGPWEVQRLKALVGNLDVSVCSCGRVGVLQHCGGQGEAHTATLAHAPAAPVLNAPAAAAAAEQAAALRLTTAPRHQAAAAAAPVPQRQCPGLCSACAELFKGCGSDVCGACWEPRAAQQVLAMRGRMQLWQVRREAMTVLRSRWTDFRFGVELRSTPASA